jgi:Flp pilus assembly protein TadD
MSKPFRSASAVSLVALASMIAGCATPQGPQVRVSGFGGKANGEVGLATRAMVALNANDFATAIDFAERAVEKTPADAGFRTLLGNAYFGAGRFASAEAAYKDALAIYANQPQAMLKLALVEIAQGKQAEAARLLQSADGVLDSANLGLALTLAGHSAEAVELLEAAARGTGADARVRQNLALAYAFSGDWTRARTIAAQDVPADQLDARLQQWMQLTNPAHASDQVAALTGVKPAASDPGQPTRLALLKPDSRQAVAAPAPQPPVVEPAPIVAEAAPQPVEAAPRMVEAAAPQVVEPAPVAHVAEAAVAPQPQPVAPAPPPEDPARVAAAKPEAPAPVIAIAQAAAMAPEAPAIFAALAPKVAAPRPAKRRAAAPAKRAPVQHAALKRGNRDAVMQLGAYGSRERVSVAWERITKRYPALRAYLPMTARFESPKGVFYRLSIQGFDSQREAIARCKLLKSNGGSCFVRGFAGDAPVQIAAR